MSRTFDVFLTPVLDRKGLLAGIWVPASAVDAGQELAAFLFGGLKGLPGGLLCFIDASAQDIVQVTKLLPPEKLRFVTVAGTGPVEAMGALGIKMVVQGQEFVPGIAEEAQYSASLETAAEWFYGSYITGQALFSSDRRDAAQTSLLQLLTLVSKDGENTEIEEIFKREPGLTFNLLRLVNSVGMGMKTQITSINHALMVLGRRQLQRWIQLLLYAGKKADQKGRNALLQLAAMRGYMMERMAVTAELSLSMQELAFMTGMFSLLEVLLGMPMAEIVQAVPLPEEVKTALMMRSGELGALLAAVDACQAGLNAELPDFIQLDKQQLLYCQLEALRWCVGIDQALS